MKNRFEKLRKFQIPQIYNVKGGMYWDTKGGDCILTGTKGPCEVYWEGKLHFCDVSKFNYTGDDAKEFDVFENEGEFNEISKSNEWFKISNNEVFSMYAN